jgi:hypothetical protein
VHWIDDCKVLGSFTLGVGNWMLEIDLLLKAAISAATLIYVILRIHYLIKNKK